MIKEKIILWNREFDLSIKYSCYPGEEVTAIQQEIDNIFKYVIPKRIFIPRTDKKIVAILCDYKFDMENGIAVVFENEKFKEIGVQDIIL